MFFGGSWRPPGPHHYRRRQVRCVDVVMGSELDEYKAARLSLNEAMYKKQNQIYNIVTPV